MLRPSLPVDPQTTETAQLAPDNSFLKVLRTNAGAKIAALVIAALSAEGCASLFSNQKEMVYDRNDDQIDLLQKRAKILQLNLSDDVKKNALERNKAQIMAANMKTIENDYEKWTSARRSQNSTYMSDEEKTIGDQEKARKLWIDVRMAAKKKELTDVGALTPEEIELSLGWYRQGLAIECPYAQKHATTQFELKPWKNVAHFFTEFTQEQMFHLGIPRFLGFDRNGSMVIVDASTDSYYREPMTYAEAHSLAERRGVSLLTFEEFRYFGEHIATIDNETSWVASISPEDPKNNSIGYCMGKVQAYLPADDHGNSKYKPTVTGIDCYASSIYHDFSYERKQISADVESTKSHTRYALRIR